MAEEDNNKVGLYNVNNLRVARPDMPGSPQLLLDLFVFAPDGTVTGHGNITQAVAPPAGNYPVINLKGVIHHGGTPTDRQFVALTGDYLYVLAPPAIGTVQHPISISLSVDDSWNGTGAFTFGGQWITGCTVSHGE